MVSHSNVVWIGTPKAYTADMPFVFSLDLHTHTRFFHGDTQPTWFDPIGTWLLCGVAKYRGLDGVALTNHDYYRPFECSLVRIPGIEITTTRGHVLVVGPDPPTNTEPGELTPEAAVDLAHDRDCAAIIAHPYRNSTVREVAASFDAIEVNGKHPRTREAVERLAEHHDLPLVGGSDAHYPFEVGRAYTAIDAEDLSPEHVVAAIRDRRVEPRVTDSIVNRLFWWLYHRIHAHKRTLDQPGIGPPPGEEET